MADHRLKSLQVLLLDIEQEMRRLRVWESVAPDPERLESAMPFCHDTLAFSQWLQWVYVPRFQALIDRGAPLPPRCDVAPLAEQSFGQLEIDTARLLALLVAVDRLVQG